jgi:hypothetical protein
MSAPNTRLPVKRELTPLPAPLWRQAAPAVARTAALVAAGVVGQWALRQAAKRALAAPFRQAKPPARTTAVARSEQPDDGVIAVSETVIMRRVIVRR